MKYLLYCIFRSSESHPPLNISGVDERPVYHLSQNGLYCAISQHNPEVFNPPQNPPISYLLSYERVIGAYHQEQTVIPLRYGCIFIEESQILQFLTEHNTEYQTLFHKIGGQVEMGIRMLIPENTRSPQPSPLGGEGKRCTGREYLEAQSRRYLKEEQQLLKYRCTIERICKPLAGLFKDCRHELNSFNGSNVLSLYFLLPRGSIEGFRQVLRQINSRESGPFLFSGPWPPYNFVLPEQNRKGISI